MEKEFIDILNKNQGIIRKVCRMYCSDREDSEDLFQEIVLQMWKSYPRYNGDAKISTWMYRLALNTAITRLRKNSRTLQSSMITDVHLELAASEDTRLDVQYQHELQVAIDSLNKFDKALMLLYLDEKSYKEMAEIMEISESNIGVKINRIKQQLKGKLKH